MKPGQILGLFGPMGSGKTAFGVFLSRYEEEINSPVKVYTNVPDIQGLIHVSKASQIPIDLTPKILFIDEAMFSLDSRLFSSNNNRFFGRFLAFLRKVEMMMIYATHDPGMVDVRLRQHTQYSVFFKDSGSHFAAMFIDCMTEEKSIHYIKKSPEYFQTANYDTRAFPDEFVVDLEFSTGRTFKYKKVG